MVWRPRVLDGTSKSILSTKTAPITLWLTQEPQFLRKRSSNGLKTNSPLSPASSLAILTWRDSLPQDPDEKELGSVS